MKKVIIGIAIIIGVFILSRSNNGDYIPVKVGEVEIKVGKTKVKTLIEKGFTIRMVEGEVNPEEMMIEKNKWAHCLYIKRDDLPGGISIVVVNETKETIPLSEGVIYEVGGYALGESYCENIKVEIDGVNPIGMNQKTVAKSFKNMKEEIEGEYTTYSKKQDEYSVEVVVKDDLTESFDVKKQFVKNY